MFKQPYSAFWLIIQQILGECLTWLHATKFWPYIYQVPGECQIRTNIESDYVPQLSFALST